MEQKKQVTLAFENSEGLAVELMVELYVFPAMSGTAIRHNHSVILHAGDAATEGDAKAIVAKARALSQMRQEHILSVLSYAAIVTGEERTALGDAATVNKLLESWANVEDVFEAVLIFNGIDPHRSHEDIRRWELAGADMAKSFVATAGGLVESLYASKKANEAEETPV